MGNLQLVLRLLFGWFIQELTESLNSSVSIVVNYLICALLEEFDGGELVEENKNDEEFIVNENDDGFIGPKLPPRMTKEEIDVFYKEMMAKFKLDDKLLNLQKN